jgi:hypothetical protein
LNDVVTNYRRVVKVVGLVNMLVRIGKSKLEK